MFRTVLAYHLVLAVAVGPLLCCCTVGKALANAPVAPARTHPISPRVSVASASHSCCAHKRSAPKPSGENKPAPAKPATPPGKCPCKDAAGKADVTTAEPTQSSVSLVLRALTLDTFFSFAPLPAPDVVPEAPAGSGGWRSARTSSPTEELLYAHHNLRC